MFTTFSPYLLHKTESIPAGVIRIAAVPGASVYGDDFDFYVFVKNEMEIITARTDDAEAVVELLRKLDNDVDYDIDELDRQLEPYYSRDIFTGERIRRHGVRVV